jgi:hypothetical protein
MEMQKIIEMLAEMKAAQARMETKIDAIQEKEEASIAKLKAKMDVSIANRKDDRKETSCQETTELRLECEETASGNMKDVREKTTACNETTKKTEPDPEMMQHVEEHQGTPRK